MLKTKGAQFFIFYNINASVVETKIMQLSSKQIVNLVSYYNIITNEDSCMEKYLNIYIKTKQSLFYNGSNAYNDKINALRNA